MRRFGIVAAACVFAVMAGWYFYTQSQAPLTRRAAESLLELAIENADRGRNDVAEEYLDRILKDVPDFDRAREIQATMYVNMRSPKKAGEAIEKLSDEYLAGRFEESVSLAKFLTSFGFMTQAEPFLERLLKIRPRNAILRKELLKCRRIAGENHAIVPLIVANLNERKYELGDLLILTSPRLYWGSAEDVKFMKNVGQKNNDSLTFLGYARKEIEDGNLSSAKEILAGVLSKRPDWQPAQISAAYVDWLTGNEEAWQNHMRSWDPAKLDEPDAWFLLGAWYRRHRQTEVAARCYNETLQREPKHIGAWGQLPSVLHELGFHDEAQRVKPYSERVALVEQYCQDLGHQSSPEVVTQTVTECTALGWHLEARSWLAFGKQHWPKYAWPEDTTNVPTANDAEPNPLRRLIPTIDFRRFPLPKSITKEPAYRSPAVETAADAPKWSLDDEAHAMGIDFHFQNGLDPERGRAYMFEFAGPGIGVIDYDGDGWPDLHLTQGAPWPVNPENTSLQDELFRNRGDGTFEPVAQLAGVGEHGYSQGPAVGDFNGDGFPDLYICNIGPNRGYRNNGDGTFTEITADAGFAGDDWSVSAAWADLNDDGLLDLYVVNYLTGDVYERICRAADGRSVQCPPMQFPAADDRLYLNRGDGSFEDISQTAGILAPDGKGMGVLVGRITKDGRLGIYVANDTTANFLFTRQGESAGIPVFEEVGALVGTAVGPLGNAQSSMGIAASDANGDGRLDLFVTNWIAETSNLFLQGTGGFFEDYASRYGLTTDYLMMEGWGAQFFDIDADGDVDLFVANGHLEEHDAKGGRMPPHLFRNREGKKFDYVASPKIGRYFQKQYLGRSVAIWDWNRDGRLDLSVSHTTDPVAVLTNRTKDIGHGLSLRLIGIKSARDPIGAQVTLTVGDRKLVRELVSGDGYAASNERTLFFGLGTMTENVTVTVNWPDGTEQRFSDLTVDTESVLIQGREGAVSLKRFDAESIKAAQ